MTSNFSGWPSAPGNLSAITSSTPWYRRPTPPAPEASESPVSTRPAPAEDEEAFRAAVRDALHAVVDQIDPDADRSQAETLIATEVGRRAEDGLIPAGMVFSATTRARLVSAVYDELFGLGPLQPLLEDDTVENIDINGCDRVVVSYSNGERHRGPAVAATDDELVEKIRLWARKGNTAREFSVANPMLNTALEDLGGARLSAVMSVTPRPCVSIRRHRLVDVTLSHLLQLGTIDEGLRQFLQAAVRARLNLVITGGTNVGKTTLLRALTSCVDPTERIATLESDFELYLHRLEERHHDVLPFESRAANSEGAGAITLHDLIPQALRHNPRRIIVGECRSTEIVPMLEAMQSGHEGSLCTVHADRAEDFFNRALILALRGGLAMPPSAIHLLVGMSVDLVVHLRRDGRTHTRFVNEILEVLPPAETERPATNAIYVPGPGGRAVPSTTPHCLDVLVEAGFDPSFLSYRDGLWGEGGVR
ncbi:CpaF family protein [Actinomadura sp. 3N407]|uniref:CpaF family protein n=1 Tax=Actinomadura sp. 3N407 TaxID=3457423 RepID=UPI003FCD7279